MVVRYVHEVSISDLMEAGVKAFERSREWMCIRGTPRRWPFLRELYKQEMPDILSAARDGGNVSPYFVDWDFTPIEMNAWCDIRLLGLPLYPQVPAGRYFIDFADPHLQIGIELDGREFHDAVKDRVRDQQLWELGWRIFRIPGYKSLPCPRRMFDDGWYRELDDDPDAFLTTLYHWAERWSEGIFWAIQYAYYLKPRERDPRFMPAAANALARNRHIEFPLQIPDDVDDRVYEAREWVTCP